MNLANILKGQYPDATPGVDYKLQDDGEGPYISEWNLGDTKPEKADLVAVEALAQAVIDQQATDEESRKQSFLKKFNFTTDDIETLRILLKD